MAEPAIEKRLAAIVAADMVGFSRLMEIDEIGTLNRLRTLRQDLIDPSTVSNRGRLVKTTGDGFLFEFASVTDAVQFAFDIQEALQREISEGNGEEEIRFRVGINLGEIIIEGDDIYGNGVNVAARLEALAEPGGILISASVHDQIRAVMDLQYRDLGDLSVKNISTPIHGYAIDINGAGDGAVPQPAEPLPSTEEKSRATIAVLPFENRSAAAEQEYFADGITEDIMAALSKSRWLLVSARNSSFAYKGQSVDVRKVGHELGADFVLEGSVRQAGSRIRVAAQLSDAKDGTQLWSERYDRELDDIFEVQDDITETIAAQIEPELGAIERAKASRKPTESLDAWGTYHSALSKFYAYTREGNEEASRLFARAIELDPKFAAAHAGLAMTMSVSAVYFGAAEKPGYMDRAVAAAQTAIALDDKDAMSYFILGRLRLFRREYDQSISDLRTAISLNPCLATAHCGLGDSLSFSGRLAEAIPHFEQAVRLSPHDPRKWLFLIYGSLTLLQLERYEEAAAWVSKAMAQPNATYWAQVQSIAVQAMAGGSERASEAAKQLLQAEPDFSSRAFAEQFLFYHHDKKSIDWYSGILVSAGLPA
jgi:adenylate cyclase